MEKWNTYFLKDIATFSQGIQVDINNQFIKKDKGLIRFIRIIDYSKNNEPPRYISCPKNSYIVNADDIVMIRYGSQTAGKVVRGISGAIANNMFKITLNNDIITNEYAYYYLLQTSVFNNLRGSQSSSTMPAITFELVGRQKILLPNIHIQKKITTILSSLDEKIELNRRINENLEQQAQALFKSWFVDFEPFKDGKFVDSELGMIPEGWKVVNLLNIAELYDSFRRPLSSRDRAPMEKLYPYYGATSVMDYVDNYIFDGIYLLMGEDGSVINEKGYPYLQYVFGKFWPNNHAHVMQGKNGFTTEMLHCFLLKKNISGIVTGAVQAKISQQSMKKILLAIPNENLCGEFACLIVPIYANIRNIINENRILSQLRDTLLPRLMSGELEIKNNSYD